jgi:hypothetical protein
MRRIPIALALVLALVAGPAAARPWRGGRGHGHWHGQHAPHHGHRSYDVDDDAFLWLGLTVLGVAAIGALTQHQRAPIGRRITWSDAGVAGDGAYCREFQQEVRIGGRSEFAWGTACLGEDGDWRITR